jgi:phosphonate transport system substrate-binding protein
MFKAVGVVLLILQMFCTPLWSVSLVRAGEAVQDSTVRFGAITLNHPLVIYQQYQPFLDYISSRQPWRYELVLERRYAGIIDRLDSGTLDVALVAGRTFLQARDRLDLIPLCAVKGADGTPTTRSVFIVRDDRADIQTLQDLAGKSMAFGSPDSTGSFMVPMDYLRRHGLGLDSFARWANLPTHDAVARAVLRGAFDAGVIVEPLALPYVNSGLRILEATPPFPGFLIVARAGLPANVVAALRSVLLGIDPADPEVGVRSAGWNEILRHGFGPVDVADYDVFRDMESSVTPCPDTHEEGWNKP